MEQSLFNKDHGKAEDHLAKIVVNYHHIEVLLNQLEAQVLLALEQENEKQKQRVTKAHQISIFSLLLATGALAIISRSPNTTSLPECFKDQSLVIQAVPAVISTSNNKPIYVSICLCQTRRVFQQYHLLSLQKCIQVSVTLFVFGSTIRVIYIFDPGGRTSCSNITSTTTTYLLFNR